jgi:hypothetical protein
MVDELPYQENTFISESSTYYQEVSQPKFTESNDLYIEPITDDHQNNENYHSTTIHSIESTEPSSSANHYIQETTSNHPEPTTTASHIEPININPNSLEQNSDYSNHRTEPDDILGNKSILKQVK